MGTQLTVVLGAVRKQTERASTQHSSVASASAGFCPDFLIVGCGSKLKSKINPFFPDLLSATVFSPSSGSPD